MAPPAPNVKNHLQNGILYRTQPKYKWEVIKEFGRMGGGLNGGIAKVRFKTDPFGREFIEKRFIAQDVISRTAHKEMALLHQVGDHPYITTMYDHFVDEKARKASLYMEYCNMESLMEVVMKVAEGKRLNEHKVWQWFIQMMDALLYCHCGHQPDDYIAVADWCRIYHRDIKPANILLTRAKVEGQERIVAKLADFGCAQSDEWTTQTKLEIRASHASAFTQGFDPPEFPQFTSVSDVWQMAVVFVCLCGLKGSPRSNTNPMGTQWNKDLPAGPYYSKELSSVLKWCLTEDAMKRPRALEVLKRLNNTYKEIKSRLPPDNQPLQIFGGPAGQSPQAPRPMPFPRLGQQMPSPGYGQHPQRPGLPGHVLSDPEIERIGRMPNNYAQFMDGQRSPQGPFPGGHPLGRFQNSFDKMLQDEDDDQGVHGAVDPRLMGGFHPHPGYFPPFHPPRRDQYGRR